MKKKNQSYYTKDKVYGDNPLNEIVYELEDAIQYDSFLDIRYVPIEKLNEITHRHMNTVKIFKEKLARLIN